MPWTTRTGLWLTALGAVGFGVLCLAFSHTVQGLEALPKGFTAETPIAWLSGVLLLALGAGLLVSRISGRAAIGLAALYLVWVLAIHAPPLAVHPTSMIAWVIATEVLALAGGAMTLAPGRLGAAGPYVFAVNLPVFALSHFVYLDAVAGMIPDWIPGHVFWAASTGLAHLAAGLAILSGVRARLAAILLGVMYGLISLATHLTPVLLDPMGRMAWTNLLLDAALAGAAFAVAGAVKDRRLTKPVT